MSVITSTFTAMLARNMGELLSAGTGQGLVAFLEYLKAKGLMKSTTSDSYRAAVSKVLEIDEDWEKLNIRHLDVEEHLRRFETLSGSNYTPGSLSTYKTRFSRSVEMYLDYLESPSSFRPRLQPRRTRSTLQETPGNESKAENASPQSTVRSTVDLIEYPFPLTTGDTAYLRLPRNLSSVDVERLSAFLRSIAIEIELIPDQDGAER